jgi:hypothetical protein
MKRPSRMTLKQLWQKFEAEETFRLQLALEEERLAALELEWQEEYAYDHYWDDDRDYDRPLSRVEQIDQAWEIYDEFNRPTGAWGKSSVPYNIEDVFMEAMNRPQAG